MARVLTPKELDELAPKIAEDLRMSRGKNRVKQIANKYKIDQGLVRSIAKTRKTGLAEFVPNNTVIDIPSNDKEIIVTTETIKTEEVIEEEKSERKKRVELSADQKLELITAYESKEFKKSELVEMYDISLATLNNILRKAKESSVEGTRKKRVEVTEDIKKSVISDYNDGKTRAELQEDYDLSSSSIDRIIKKAKEDGEVDMSRRNGNVKRKRKGSFKGNNHQFEKAKKEYESKYMEEINEDDFVDEEVVEEVNTDIINFCGVEFSDPNIKRLQKPVQVENSIDVGMIAERHDMGDIPYIFTSALTNDQLNDVLWQEHVVDQYITDHFEFDENGNSTKYMNLYCTGLQVVLGSIIRACLMRHVNLNLNHFVSGSNYLTQVILDQFGTKQEAINYPFEKMKGNIYTYDCDLSDIINKDNLCCMALNKHIGYKNEFDYENCSYIIFKDDSHIWELYPQLVKICQNSTTGEHNSVLLSNMCTSNTNYWWGDNISKSFNYK